MAFHDIRFDRHEKDLQFEGKKKNVTDREASTATATTAATNGHDIV